MPDGASSSAGGGARRVRAIVDADGRGPDGTAADAIEVTLANYCDVPRAWRWVAVAPDAPMARGAAGYIAVGLLRLFRNGCGYEYREPVHENITESVLESGGRIRSEPVVVHHYGYGAQSANADAKARHCNYPQSAGTETGHSLCTEVGAQARAETRPKGLRTPADRHYHSKGSGP